MTSSPSPIRFLVADANVLIDYVEADDSVLEIAALHLAPIHVPTPILREVMQLDLPRCQQIGLVPVTPTLEHLTQAGVRSKTTPRRVSFEDWLCFFLAQDLGATCLTNDGALLRVCEEAGVPVLRGLALMTHLVAAGHLPASAALEIAESIHETNPYITRKVLDQFGEALKAATSPKAPRKKTPRKKRR